MPSATIPIASYTVQVARNTSTQFTKLTIAGPVLAHGIQNTATLYFFPSYDELNAWATNVGGLNFDGIHVVAQVPFGDFARMYDAIRSEAPVSLYYTYGSSTTTTKPVTLVAIQSGAEPPGEGPEDESSVAAAFTALLKARTFDLVR